MLLGSSWGSWSHPGGHLGVLGASWRRLDGVLGRLGVLGNAEERLTMLACVREQGQDLRSHGHVRVTTRPGGP